MCVKFLLIYIFEKMNFFYINIFVNIYIVEDKLYIKGIELIITFFWIERNYWIFLENGWWNEWKLKIDWYSWFIFIGCVWSFCWYIYFWENEFFIYIYILGEKMYVMIVWCCLYYLFFCLYMCGYYCKYLEWAVMVKFCEVV